MDSNPVYLEEEEKALFVDSNLGTYLAISVPPDFTVALLKGKLAYEHFLCFPDFGEIKVQKVMVKQKSVLYQLPDSMVIKCAFQGLSKSWFIHMETTNSLKMKAVTETRNLASDIGKERDNYAAGEGLKESAIDKMATSAKGSNLSKSLSDLNLNKHETENSLKMKAITETMDLASDVQKGRDQYAAGEGLKESAVDKMATSAKGPNLSKSLSDLNLNKHETANSLKMKAITETMDLASDVQEGRDQYAAGEGLKESAVDKMATSAKGPNLSKLLSDLNLNKHETANSLKMKSITEMMDLASDVQKGRDQYAAGEGLKESAVDKVATIAKRPNLSESLSGLNLNNDEAMNSCKMKVVTEIRDLASDAAKGRDQYAAGEVMKESVVDKVATSDKGPDLSESLPGLNLNKNEHSSEGARNNDNYPKFEVSDRNGMHLTEETSVTDIIFKYFCESDEMSTCSCRPGSAAKFNKSAKARKRSNNEDVCSSNAADLNAEQSKHGSLRVKKRSDIPRKRKKLTSSVVMNKHKTNRNGAIVNSKATSTRRISSLHSPFGKHMDALNRNRDASEVGKRLVQAASNIALSAHPSQSPISLLIQKHARSIPCKSAPSVRHLAFEIDDNEVEEHV
ncbi:hypothetical protein IHE45_14G049500 [Dioscorea alata]|uniref:Uncharacterized protein n=1 Tax=Dioscorea alata TaxID=55571 RepID=A0ACB7URU6_DIOAL|nr:hypothetical protein IHE45_14G049500 [Dioscorea alata]